MMHALSAADRLFEAQLECIGLTECQIEQQSLAELEESLVLIQQALSLATSLVVLRLSTAASAGLDSSSQIEIDLMPLLLKREKLIIDRIRLLRGQRTLKTLNELIDSVTDQQLQEQLRTDLEKANRIDVMKTVEIRPDYAFIVMAMDPQNRQLEDIHDALKEGASRCNVRAERIDDVASNQPITVRILNAIKEAGHVLVVLSHHRENVFFEAGFAEGIGKTPIYLAEAGTAIPFDLKDYPIIFYTNMRELRELIEKKLTAIRISSRSPGLPGSCS